MSGGPRGKTTEAHRLRMMVCCETCGSGRNEHCRTRNGKRLGAGHVARDQAAARLAADMAIAEELR